MSTLQGFARTAIDPFHSGDALKDYVQPTTIELDYVPGITQLGYLYELLTNSLGERWLRGGTLSARFLAPLYNGETVRVDGRPTEGQGGDALAFELWIEKSDGTRVTVATARCG